VTISLKSILLKYTLPANHPGLDGASSPPHIPVTFGARFPASYFFCRPLRRKRSPYFFCPIFYIYCLCPYLLGSSPCHGPGAARLPHVMATPIQPVSASFLRRGHDSVEPTICLQRDTKGQRSAPTAPGRRWQQQPCACSLATLTPPRREECHLIQGIGNKIRAESDPCSCINMRLYTYPRKRG